MKTFQAAGYISIFGLIATILINSFLIFLTIFHIKHIYGTYKSLILWFSILGIVFSAWDVIMRPSVHNYNGGFIFFSLNSLFPTGFLSFAIACYSGFYSLILAFVAVQFLYRYFTLTGNLWLVTFRGWKILIWIYFALIPCACFVIFDTFLISPDSYSDEYMRWEVYGVYNLTIEDVPRFILIPWRDDVMYWKHLWFVILIAGVMELELIIIGYCAYRMTRELKLRMKILSEKNRRLEAQFFKALLAQSTFPTLLLALPTGPVLLLPLFDIKISLQSGLLYSLFSLFPSIDSVAMMMIITEYRDCARMFWYGLKKVPNASINPSISLNTISVNPTLI